VGRGTFYCVVPRELGFEVYDLLRAHWRDDPSITVVRDRRVGERRRDAEGGGRRVRERRGTGPVEPPVTLPRRLCAYGRRLVFGARRDGVAREPEDVDSDRLIVRIQQGDHAAFDELYSRYFDRVYAYARVALRDDHEAEDVAQQVFGNVIQALPRYQVREDSSFRAWLFRITRNVVLRTLSRNGRMQPQEPAEMDRRLESPAAQAPFSLEWLSDKDLSMLVERLPVAQRQVILLRYVLDFKTNEPEHHAAVWELLGRYEDWLVTAPRAAGPGRPGTCGSPGTRSRRSGPAACACRPPGRRRSGAR
jgi:RNA polymerase sigma factor (sigma-70 family)